MMYNFIQVNILLIGFYLLYLVFLRQLTFYSLNRYLLLSVPVLAFVLPFLRFAELNLITTSYVLPIFTVVNEGIPVSDFKSSYNWWPIIYWVYSIGFVLFIGRFAAILINLFHYLRKFEFTDRNELKITTINNKDQSFSFFHFIVINQKDIENYDLIISHEEQHVRLFHSLDKLYIELLTCIFWFNPFIYLLKKDISNNHEFEVDKLMNTSKEEGKYILQLSESLPILREKLLTNSFNSKSNLLKRITMMTKRPSPGAKKLNYLLMIPLTLLAVLIFSCAEQLREDLSTETSMEEKSEVYSGERIKEVTEMPQYAGGSEAMYQFLIETIKYPKEAKDQGIAGKVFISFVISAEGIVEDVKVTKGIHPSLDKVALEVVNQMPDWVPGKVGSNNVAVQYMLPILFKLPERESGYEIIYREDENGALLVDSIMVEK